MFTFSRDDSYKISHKKKEEKFKVDYKVLIRLYQPIIGSIATSLYLTLESETSLNQNHKNNLTIARLHKILQINDAQFNEAIETLKQNNLLSYKANQKKANDYLFILYPTLSAFEFLSNNKLNNALSVVVDDIYYKQVYNYFITSFVNEDEYVDIEDVKLDKSLTFEEFFSQFYEKYPIISTSCNIDDASKEELLRVKKLFSLTYEELESYMLKSFEYDDQKMILNLNKLNELISEKYKKTIVDNSDETIIKTFESIKPLAYYKQLANREALLPSETAMISDLLDQYKISNGVLNVIINYYFSYGSKSMVSKNYFVKIIENMLMNNVKTTLDAMNYFRNRNKKFKNYNEKNNTKTTPLNNDNSKLDKQEIDKDTLDEFRKAFGG